MSTLSEAMDTFMFVGCYSRKMGHAAGLGKGISVYKFDTMNGDAKYITNIPESACGFNPTAFYINNKTNYIYACNEFSKQSGLTGVQFDPNNNFQVIQQFTNQSFGFDPCFAISDCGQDYIYIANYGGIGQASVVVYKIDAKSNHLIPFAKHIINEPGTNAIPSRQALPHMHCIMPCKNLADPLQFYTNDLGRDRIYHYKINKNDGSLSVISSLKFRPGDGPRHMAYNPSINGILYISQEMGSAISVVQFDYKTNKLLNILQTVTTLPNDIINDAGSVYTTSHIMCDKTATFVYCANRGHDSIVRYVIDKKSGILNENIGAAFYKCGGKVPRHFNIDPTNNYLIVANQEGAPFDNISIFKIDHNNNGALQFMRCIRTGTPSYISFIQKPKKLKKQILSSKL